MVQRVVEVDTAHVRSELHALSRGIDAITGQACSQRQRLRQYAVQLAVESASAQHEAEAAWVQLHSALGAVAKLTGRVRVLETQKAARGVQRLQERRELAHLAAERDAAVSQATTLNHKLSVLMREQKKSREVISRLRSGVAGSVGEAEVANNSPVRGVQESPQLQLRLLREADVERTRSEALEQQLATVLQEKFELMDDLEMARTDESATANVKQLSAVQAWAEATATPLRRPDTETSANRIRELEGELAQIRAEATAAVVQANGRRCAVAEAHQRSLQELEKLRASLAAERAEADRLRRKCVTEAAKRATLEHQLEAAAASARSSLEAQNINIQNMHAEMEILEMQEAELVRSQQQEID